MFLLEESIDDIPKSLKELKVVLYVFIKISLFLGLLIVYKILI